MKKYLLFLQWALGAMDSVTGVLLVVAPVGTLRLMGVKEEVASPLMVSWVGVFVLAVGLSYFFVRKVPVDAAGWAGWRMQWKISGLVRVLVGCFVGWLVLGGVMEGAWVSVAVTDLVVAGLQFLGLRRGWLEGDS